ncbi:hypothetical protein QQF64_019870, partial [Cirrhinus molitorella]
SVHCCGPTEAVIRLGPLCSGGVATVILRVYDIRSRRAGQDQAHQFLEAPLGYIQGSKQRSIDLLNFVDASQGNLSCVQSLEKWIALCQASTFIPVQLGCPT